jgi:putative transposase
MPRKIHTPSAIHPYHITNRCPNRRPFPTDMETTWSIMSEMLYETKYRYNFVIHSFVLMPNHYHLLTSTPDANLSRGLNFFTSRVSKKINCASKTINQNFGARNYQCLVNSYHYYMNAYKYVLRNPVQAGLCKNVEDYRFSTLHGLLGQKHLFIPVEEDVQLFPVENLTDTLRWLNTPPTPENLEALRRAFRKPEFSLPKVGTNRLPHPLETQLF